MKEPTRLLNKVNLSLLTNPVHGRIYLKTALDRDNEQVFLQVLHNIIDSFADSELDFCHEPTRK